MTLHAHPPLSETSGSLHKSAPGMMSPDTPASSSLVRTSTASTPGTLTRLAMCSLKEPCKASTPMRVAGSAIEELLPKYGQGGEGNQGGQRGGCTGEYQALSNNNRDRKGRRRASLCVLGTAPRSPRYPSCGGHSLVLCRAFQSGSSGLHSRWKRRMETANPQRWSPTGGRSELKVADRYWRQEPALLSRSHRRGHNPQRLDRDGYAAS